MSGRQASTRLPRDIDEFLSKYPTQDVDEDDVDDGNNKNLLFYTNIEPCLPDDLLIDDLHKEWWGAYDELEYNHGYIQWLFPIREHGMNFQAQPLHPREIAVMKETPRVIGRLLTSYKLMLDFYGMQLLDADTGLICRSDNYERRYRNLSRSPHNNLRISRILKCLSEFGLERLNAGFLLHILVEQSTHRQLVTSNLVGSMDRFWANCIRDDREREWLGELIRRVRRGQLGFERDDYERVMLVRERKGYFEWKMNMDEEDAEAEVVQVDVDGKVKPKRKDSEVKPKVKNEGDAPITKEDVAKPKVKDEVVVAKEEKEAVEEDTEMADGEPVGSAPTAVPIKRAPAAEHIKSPPTMKSPPTVKVEEKPKPAAEIANATVRRPPVAVDRDPPRYQAQQSTSALDVPSDGDDEDYEDDVWEGIQEPDGSDHDEDEDDFVQVGSTDREEASPSPELVELERSALLEKVLGKKEKEKVPTATATAPAPLPAPGPNVLRKKAKAEPEVPTTREVEHEVPARKGGKTSGSKSGEVAGNKLTKRAGKKESLEIPEPKLSFDD